MSGNLLDGPKAVRVEVMMTEEMYLAVRTRARQIADPGDGRHMVAEAVRQLIAEAAGRRGGTVHQADREEARALAQKTIAKTKAKWEATKAARRS